MHSRLIFIYAVLLSVTAGTSITSASIYWGDFGNESVNRANDDGSSPQIISRGNGQNVIDVAIDGAGQKVYWTENVSVRIRRANLDGSNSQTIYQGSVGNEGPEHVALDLLGGKVYWTDDVIDHIRRANLDGTNVEDVVTSGTGNPYGIALDTVARKIYWADFQDGRLMRSNMDGSSVETVTSGGNAPYDVALDVPNQTAYFSTFNGSSSVGNLTIEAVRFDGSGRHLVVGSLGFPRGVALNLDLRKVYWTDDTKNQIGRANLDGSGKEVLISSGLFSPAGITYIPEPSFLSLFCCGSLLIRWRK